MVDLGIANVIARFAFVNHVDESLCTGCGLCVERCSFEAISLQDWACVDSARCVGCGVCVLACPQEALSLTRRPPQEIMPPPISEENWREERAATRGIDLSKVL